MNGLEFFSAELCVWVCVTLIHSVWQAFTFLILAWLVDRCWRHHSASMNYNAYVAALILSCVAVPATFLFVSSQSGASDFSFNEVPPSSSVSSRSIAVPQSLGTEDANQASVATGESTEQSDWSSARSQSRLQSNALMAGDRLLWKNVAPWIAGLYAIGAMLMFARFVLEIIRAERMRLRSRFVDEGHIAEALQQLAEAWSLRVVPLLASSEQAIVPRVVGILKPTILLPCSAMTGLSPEELRMILAHELAHVRRNDMWVNLIQRLAEVSLFFNPAIWILSRRVSALREYCCDDLACNITEPSDPDIQLRYAGALLHVLELSQVTAGQHAEFADVAASGRSASELRRRVARLIGEPMRESLGLSHGGLLIVLACGALLAMSTFWQANAKTSESQPKPAMELAHNDERLVEIKKHCETVYTTYGERGGERFLKSLDLWGVTDPALHALSEIRGLESLQFTASDLNTIAFADVGKLTTLKSVSAVNCKLLPSQMEVFRGLNELETLELMFSVFDESKETRETLLGELTDNERQAWMQLTDDGVGDHIIQAALLTDRAMPSLSHLVKLKSLKLINTSCTSSSLVSLGSLVNLETADLPIIDLTPEALQPIHKLSKLRSLRYFNADDAIVAELSQFAELEQLEIWSEGVSDVGVDDLLKLTKLKRLEIRGNRITDTGLTRLAELQRLEFLDLTYSNRITAEGIQAFNRNLPNCNVKWAASSEEAVGTLMTHTVWADGRPAQDTYVTLWRALVPGDREPTNSVNGPGGFGLYDPVIWDDASSGTRWVRAGSAQPRSGRPRPDDSSYLFDSLRPGNYRLTAMSYRNGSVPDPTPYGVSEPFELTENAAVDVTVHLDSDGASLVLKAIDVNSRQPVQGLALRLRNDRHMPIVHGHGSGNYFERTGKDGTVEYGQLMPGEYSVQVLGKQASANSFVQYEPVKEWKIIAVEEGENSTEIALDPRELEQVEIDERFPFSVTGQVTDGDGQPMDGVEVRAATGVGTLLGGGSTVTDAEGKYRLYFSPGVSNLVDAKRAPLGVGIQAAHFYVHKPGWRLDADERYLFYLMTDQTQEQFRELLRKQTDGRYWEKDSVEEVVFAHEPREVNFVIVRDSTDKENAAGETPSSEQ